MHSAAARAEDTDRPQIAELYGLRADLAPGPMVRRPRRRLAMVRGPRAGLALAADGWPERHRRLHAVRAYLLEMAGDRGYGGYGLRATPP